MDNITKEVVPMPLPKTKTYTLEHIYTLPDDEHTELIDGQIFNKLRQEHSLKFS